MSGRRLESPDANPKGDVRQQIWVPIDSVDCRDRHLRSLHSVLFPAVKSSTFKEAPAKKKVLLKWNFAKGGAGERKQLFSLFAIIYIP